MLSRRDWRGSNWFRLRVGLPKSCALLLVFAPLDLCMEAGKSANARYAEYFHVMIYKAPMEFLDSITGGDQAMSEKVWSW